MHTMNLDRIIELSFALAGKYPYNKRCRHFSFIFERNRLISIGINNPKTHPLNLKFNYISKKQGKINEVVGTHSELSAVIKTGLPLDGNGSYKGFTIVNTRINRNEQLDYSYPCNGCWDMIKKLGFKKLLYTTKEQKFETLKIT
jgi:hypothetical protein